MSDSRRYKARSDNYKESLCLPDFHRSMLYFHPVASFTKSGEQNCTVLLSFICEDNEISILMLMLYIRHNC